MNTLYDLIIIELADRIGNIQLYTNELYGYGDSLPEYRIFKRKLYVDFIDNNGKLHRDILMNTPETFPNNVNYDNLITLHLHTGLLQLLDQLNELRIDPLEESLFSVIEGIYDNEFKVVGARMVIEEAMIQKMYAEIIKQFNIETK